MNDLISRQAAIDAIHEDADWLAAQGSDWQVERMERDKSILKSLPTVSCENNTEITGYSKDTISRQAAIDAIQKLNIPEDMCVFEIISHIEVEIATLPSAQPERLTDDDFETIRIHLNSYREKLCNQHRWKEAEEYQRIIDRFMVFASAQPNHNAEVSKKEIIHCKDCKHWNLQVGNVKGDGLGSCDFHNVNLVTGEGFCYWADKRGEADG